MKYPDQGSHLVEVNDNLRNQGYGNKIQILLFFEELGTCLKRYENHEPGQAFFYYGDLL